jgi:hypothetical protein
MLIMFGLLMLLAVPAQAEIKYIDGYYRESGTYVAPHYRDVSNDGNPYNNANYLGYND